MYNEADQKAIRKLKRTNYIIFSVFVLLVIGALIWGGKALYWRSFTTEKWLDHPDKRERMVADLMEDHPLTGLTSQDVSALLGPADSTADHQLRYYLGEAFPIDSVWLIVDLENNLVTNYTVTTD